MVITEQAVPISILVGIGLFFLTLITLAILVIRKKFLHNSVMINFISDGGYITKKRYNAKNILKTIDYDGGKYIYNKQNEINTFRGKEIYFYVNNPHSIDIKNINSSDGNINSENLKAIVETELIAKLFKKEIVSFDNILLLIVILLSIGSLIVLFMIMSKGVILKDVPQNSDLIINAIKSALQNG